MGQHSISISAARLRPPALYLLLSVCVALQLPETWYQAGPAPTGIRAFERTVKQSKLEPPYPCSQTARQKRDMVHCFLSPWGS